jgi:hypothetical protein
MAFFNSIFEQAFMENLQVPRIPGVELLSLVVEVARVH